MKEGKLLISDDGSDDVVSGSKTSLLLNNSDAANENERKDFWNRADTSIAAAVYYRGAFLLLSATSTDCRLLLVIIDALEGRKELEFGVHARGSCGGSQRRRCIR